MLYVVLLSWLSALIKNQGTFSDYHELGGSVRTYVVGGDWGRSYLFGIFTCFPIHYDDGAKSQCSRFSLFSALTKNLWYVIIQYSYGVNR